MTLFHRRQLLQAGAVGAAALAGLPVRAEKAAAPLKFRLGLVTYNLAAAWDLDTLLEVCKDVGVSPVELRTTHKHGVEPSLSKEQRKEVKKKCADCRRRHLGLRHRLRISVAEDAPWSRRTSRRARSSCELVADLGGRGVKVRPNGVAGQGAGREDAGADRQGAHPVRQGGRRRRASKSGSRFTATAPRIRRT